VPEEPPALIKLLPASAADPFDEGSFIVIVRTLVEFSHWLGNPAPGLEEIQVEGLMGDAEVWAIAAQSPLPVPLDVVLSDPASEFSALYRLVEVRNVRPVRVTIPAKPGFLKAMRLAASLQLPVLLIPGQPGLEVLNELTEAAHFYLHDPMVEAPVEFFHSLLIAFRDLGGGTLWTYLEQDPAFFSQRDAAGQALLPQDFVEALLARLLKDGAECATCRWQPLCAGYFKWPNSAYDCAGVKQLFALLESAADEITRDLATQETSSQP
jgi:hypothetical protein